MVIVLGLVGIMAVLVLALLLCLYFPKRKKGYSRQRAMKAMEPYFFIFPVVVLLLGMFAYPLVKSVIMSFQEYSILAPDNVKFNGLDNYKKLFVGQETRMILKNTLIYVFVSVGCQFVLGMILALALRKKFRGRGIFQAIVFLPWSFSGFVIGLMYRWSFNGEYGVVNELLLNFGLINKPIAWLGTPGYSLAVVIIAMIWMGIPFFAIMYLAALQSIPLDVYEAAELDGCSGIKKFTKITVPYIKPTIITTLLLRTIWVFNSFDLVLVITNGGPANTSQTLPSFMYAKAFANYDFGFASALGVVLMLVLGAYALTFMKVTNYDKAGDF